MTVTFPNRSGRPPARIEMFDDLVSRIPQADSKISATLEALTTGYRELLTQKARIDRDETATPGLKLVKTARAARKIATLVESLDAARETAKQHAAQLRAELSGTYDRSNPTFSLCMRHQEIRSYVRSLPTRDRINLIEKARTEGDEDTLLALASGQPFLSGIAPQLQQYVRDHFIQTYAPTQAANLKLLAEQEELAVIVRENALQSVSDLVDLKKAEEIEAAAREDAAA